MKKDKKIIQAIVVIIVVGIGWVYNLDRNSFLYEQIHSASVTWNNSSTTSDTLQLKEKKSFDENKLFIYTKNIIDSSIQHLISNL
jgi:hypothetical protein